MESLVIIITGAIIIAVAALLFVIVRRQTVDYIIQHNLVNTPDNAGLVPLAKVNNVNDACRLLEAGADANFVMKSQLTPLTYRLFIKIIFPYISPDTLNNFEIEKELVNHGADVNRIIEVDNGTPLLYPFIPGMSSDMIIQFHEAGWDINLETSDGRTAIFFATKLEQLKAFIDCGADLTHETANNETLETYFIHQLEKYQDNSSQSSIAVDNTQSHNYSMLLNDPIFLKKFNIKVEYAEIIEFLNAR